MASMIKDKMFEVPVYLFMMLNDGTEQSFVDAIELLDDAFSADVPESRTKVLEYREWLTELEKMIEQRKRTIW